MTTVVGNPGYPAYPVKPAKLGGSHGGLEITTQKGLIYNPLFKLGHDENHHVSFFFTALWTAAVLALVLALDDLFDQYVVHKIVNSHNRRTAKFFIHLVTTFVATLALIYIFRIIWGSVYL
jgi:hypothetical protein